MTEENEPPDESPDESSSEPEKETPRPMIHPVGDWKLVRVRGWEVSVGPDGLLMLPRHVHPREVEEFCEAMTAAADVGMQVIAENQRPQARAAALTLPQNSGGAVISEGPAPEGLIKMTVTARQARERGTIGTYKQRDPRAPRTTPQPGPPGVPSA